MKAFLKKLLKDISGNVLMVSGAGSVALVGGAGLGVDTVQWYLWKRQLQQAVDSSALAGAQARVQGTPFATYATQELNRNANTTVTIESMVNPPATGAFTGSNLAVEVIASTNQALPFSSVFLATSPTIRARAVAATIGDGEHCVISLAPSGVGVNVAGYANVQLGCGVAANSEGASAIDLDGTSYLGGSPLSAVGGIDYRSSNIASGTLLQPYGVAQTDPLASRGLTVPASPAACADTNLTVGTHDDITISPGRYCNGITVRGELTLNPGVYIIDRGELKVTSHAEINGQGVTIILTGNTPSNIATIDMSGGAEINLRAPTAVEDATWKNILIFQDQSANFPLSKVAGGVDLTLEGIVYMPSGDIRFSGNSGQHADCLLMVVNRVNFVGTSSLDNNCPTDFDDVDLSALRVRVVE